MIWNSHNLQEILERAINRKPVNYSGGCWLLCQHLGDNAPQLFYEHILKR